MFFNLANKIFNRKEKLHEIEDLFLLHFVTISSNLALLHLPNENICLVSPGVNTSIKNGPNPLWLIPHMMTLKSPTQPICSSKTTMIRQRTKSPPSASFPMENWSPGYSLPCS